MTAYHRHIKPDWILIGLYLALVFSGWIAIYAVTGNDTFSELFNFNTSYGKQLLWIGLSFVLILLTFAFDSHFFERYSGVIYLFAIFLLLGLFVFGKNINGQTNWYSFGGFSLQPSEFVKIAVALAVASIVGDNLFNVNVLKDLSKALIIILLPIFIIIIQKDVGSAIVFLSFIFVLIRKGLNIRLFIILAILALLFILTIKIGVKWALISTGVLLSSIILFAQKRQPLFITRNFPILIIIAVSTVLTITGSKYAFEHILEPHHQDRLKLWLKTESDPDKIYQLKRTYGYNNDQSIKTIASGGFAGKGFLQGDRTNGQFVPAQSTDYIFSAVGEEFGFLGSAFVILLFSALILRLIYKAEKQKNNFNKYYGYGVAAVFFTHFFVNIGMVLDLLPTVGIPLPFFSYGGSSLWSFTLLLFIFIKLDAGRIDDF